MTDDQNPTPDHNHNPQATNPDHVEGGSTTRGSTQDTTVDTTLGTSRTGGMGGMAGTVSADTDMSGTQPSGELEDQ